MHPVCVYTDPACLGHDPGPEHPEQVARLEVVLDALRHRCPVPLRWQPAPEARREQLLLAHRAEYIDALASASPDQGLHRLDSDTVMSPGSYKAALHAAGGVCAAVDAVLAGDCHRAFCAVRPPGHHAEADQAMGFCLFNNVAIGALHAQSHGGVSRVAVIDFDVHHGNGTEAILSGLHGLMYLSTHQHPLYPGTGVAAPEVAANVVDVPVDAGTNGEQLARAFATTILPALEAFRPELLLVSAGFDAHRDDPLAGLDLVASDFAELTRALVEIADRHADGRLVSVLEGGYALEALAESVIEHVSALA